MKFPKIMLKLRWDMQYSVHASSWDIDEPPRELVEMVEGGRIAPCRALDVGCGTGNSTIYLASKGFDSVGIDVSSVAIRRAKEKAARRSANCRFYMMNLLDAKTVSNVIKDSFDLVMDHGCFHNMRRKDRRLYLHFLRSLTRPGSTYLLWSFHPGSRKLWRHICIDPEEVRELFSQDFKLLEERIVTREYMLYIMERKESFDSTKYNP